MTNQTENTNIIQRVVEIDDKRVNHIQGLVEDLKEGFYALREQLVKQSQVIDRLEIQNEKMDGALRGNGKEGLNTTVIRLEEKMDGVPKMIQEEVKNAVTEMSLSLNTAKVRAITQEEIKKALEAPGGWSEFRKSWMFPIFLSVITALIGGLIGKFLIP